MTKLCPICNGIYKLVNDNSYLVCQNHQNWLVTVCEICKTPCFSDCVGVCPDCLSINDSEAYAHYSTTLRNFTQ